MNKILKLKKTKLVFVSGESSDKIVYFLDHITDKFYNTKKIKKPLTGLFKLSLLFNYVFILKDDNFKTEELKDFFNLFSEVIVIINNKKIKRGREIIKALKKKDTLFIDHPSKDKLPGKRLERRLSYGFDKEADFYISDVNKSQKTNFKLNYSGSTVPFWMEKDSEKEDILVTGVVAGTVVLLGINFIEVSKNM